MNPLRPSVLLLALLVTSVFAEPTDAPVESPAPPKTVPDSVVIDPTGGPPDEQITARLADIFSQLEDLAEIQVESAAGVVTLSGSVPGNRSADEALALARKVDGVVYVRSRIEEATEVSARVSPAMARLREIGNRTVQLLPVIGVTLLVILAFYFLGSLLSRSSAIFRLFGFSDLASALVRRVIRTVIVGLGILIALEILDATAVVGAVLGIAGVAGVALGFAFRNIVENYLAGILLSTRNPFNIGDHVEIDGSNGKVARLTSRDTVLMTLDGNHLRIPNSAVINQTLINFTRNPLRRFHFAVGVSVDLDLNDARRVGMETLKAMRGVLADPPPMILVEELGDSTVNLRFFGWIDQTHSDFLKSRSEAIRMIKSAFDEADIEMPEPIYRVHLRDNTAPLETSLEPEPRPKKHPTERPDPAQADVGADDTIDKQVAADLEQSEEPNLLDR
ncbi:MAG: mechanosensitive ion channel family protein, partial [Chthoniobacterales bacterium]